MGRLNCGYTEISGVDGKDELYTNLYVLGHKDLRVTDVKLGYYKLSSNDGVTKGVKPSQNYDIASATSDIVEGLDENDSGEMPLDYINCRYNPKEYKIKLELKQNGKEISFFNQKVIQTVMNNELLSSKGEGSNVISVSNYVFSAKHPQKVQIEFQFPSGLMALDSDGKKKSPEVKIGVQVSLDGGNTWIDPHSLSGVTCGFDFSQATGVHTETNNVDMNNGGKGTVAKFANQKSETLRYVYNFDITDYQVAKSIVNNILEFRVTRENLSNELNTNYTSATDRVIVSKVRTWCYNNKKSELENDFVKLVPIGDKIRNKSTRLGFQILAGGEIESSIEKINCILQTKCRIWDKEKKEWTTEKYVTSNPSALALHVMTGDFRGAYAYSDSKIDYDSFGEFYEWCDQDWDFGAGGILKRFSCDGSVIKATKTSEVVANILACGRGSLALNGKRYGVLIDRPRKYTTHILNNQNIISRSNVKEFNEIPDGMHVKFLNALLDNSEDEIVAMPKGKELTDTSKLNNVEYAFINNAYRAKAMGLYQLALMVYRPENWFVKLTTDGNLIELGNKIEIQDDTISVGIGDGAEIVGFIYNDEENPTAITGIITDGNFPVNDLSLQYGIKTIKYYDTESDGAVPHKIAREVVFNEIGYHNVLMFKMAYSLEEDYQFEIGDTISFGLYGKETVDSLCIGKKENGDGTFEITLAPYDERVYEADDDSFEWTDYDSKVTPPQMQEVPVKDEVVTKSDVIDIVLTQTSSDRDVTPPTVPVITNGSSNSHGNINLIFNGSTDEQSGVAYYSIFRREENGFYSNVARISHSNDIESYSMTDLISDKNKKYIYAITATDKAGNESGYSNTIEITSVVTERPYNALNFSVKLQDENRLGFSWSYPETDDTVYRPYLFKIEIKRGDTDWELLSKQVGTGYTYYFDRDVDGYIEKEDLEKYSFRISSESYYGITSSYNEAELDCSEYKTWKIAKPVVTLKCFENYSFLTWNGKTEDDSWYGFTEYEVSLNGVVIKSGITGTTFEYRYNSYPEVSDLEELEFTVKATTVADSVTSEVATVDTSSYKTYKIGKPLVSAIAYKDYLQIDWNLPNDSYLTKKYSVYIGEEEVANNIDSSSYVYLFDGKKDKSVVAGMSVTVKAKSLADESVSDEINPNVTNYLGYDVTVPQLYASSSSRNVNLKWDEQNVYDWEGVDIQVAKGYKLVDGKYTVITDEEELEWYAPALGLNPYENYDAYKRGEIGGYLQVKDTSVSFSVPLYGQNHLDDKGVETPEPVNTMYVYRVRAKSALHNSDWSDAYFIEAKCTSAYDVVKAWDLNDEGERVKINGSLGANQIFVNELASLSANLGYITDGAMQGDRYNYWAVNDTPMSDGTILHKGAFRVGGAKQYILVEPVLEDGVATGEYNVSFVVNDMNISSEGTVIENSSFTVKDDFGILFQTSNEGNLIRVNEGTFERDVPLIQTEESLNKNEVAQNVLLSSLQGFSTIVHNFVHNNKNYSCEIIYELGKLSEEENVNSYINIKSDEESFDIHNNNSKLLGLFSYSNELYCYALGSEFTLYKVDFEAKELVYFYNIENIVSFGDFEYLVQVDNFILFVNSDSMIIFDFINNVHREITDDMFYNNFVTSDEDYLYFVNYSTLVSACSRINKQSFRIDKMPLPYANTYKDYYNKIFKEINNFSTFYRVNSLTKVIDGFLQIHLMNPRFIISNGENIDFKQTDEDYIAYIDLRNCVWNETNVFPNASVYKIPNMNYYLYVEANSLCMPLPASINIRGFNVYCSHIAMIQNGSNDLQVEATLGCIYITEIEDYETPYTEGLITYKGSVKIIHTVKMYDNDVNRFFFNFGGYLISPQAYLDNDGFVTVYYTRKKDEEYHIEAIGRDSLIYNEHLLNCKITYYKTYSDIITERKTYEAGVGFKTVLKDEKQGIIRYCLDTGAFIEFDRNGNLISNVKGEKGDVGAKGEKGDNGENGKDGSSLISVSQVSESSESEGINTIRFTNADGTSTDFNVKNGKKGEDGSSISITSTSITYVASSSGTEIPTEGWSENIPTVSDGQYLWTKTTVTYSDETSTTSYSVGYKGTSGTSAVATEDTDGLMSSTDKVKVDKYIPQSGGVSGYVLKSNGTSAPTWGTVNEIVRDNISLDDSDFDWIFN